MAPACHSCARQLPKSQTNISVHVFVTQSRSENGLHKFSTHRGRVTPPSAHVSSSVTSQLFVSQEGVFVCVYLISSRGEDDEYMR